MWTDPIVEETRKVRDEYASRFDYDLEAIFRDLKAQEMESGEALASYPPRAPHRDEHRAA